MAAKKTFEENMARLEEIVSKLEKGDAQLGDSLKLFEEGTKLVGLCRRKKAKTVEKRIFKNNSRACRNRTQPACAFYRNLKLLCRKL